MQLDMTLESSAILAATSLAKLPTLPAAFNASIGSETCIWFNAFAGRIYRCSGVGCSHKQWSGVESPFYVSQ